jgi:16S rRNA (guanine(966)-N(2))-methyltransferase RsmD
MAKPAKNIVTGQEKVELRIVAGSLRGRKVTAIVHEGLRPTPQAVRESLFSILGNAVPGRPFIDLYAGTGIVGLEAVSRGANHAWLVERDPKQVKGFEAVAERYEVKTSITAVRADALAWAERWRPPAEPATVFFSPPFPDLTDDKRPIFIKTIAGLTERLAPDSVIAIQVEEGFPVDELPNPGEWDVRTYGRNVLGFWVKPMPVVETPPATES